MLSNFIKLKFHKKHFSQNRTREFLDNETNIEEIKSPSTTCKEEFLTDKNLSIMTDTQLEPDVVDNVCLRQKIHINARTHSSHSSSSTDSQGYVLIASEEIPVVLNTNYEYVNYHDITESMRRNSTEKKYCSPKGSIAWFLKLRREILKNCRNKIYPLATNG